MEDILEREGIRLSLYSQHVTYPTSHASIMIMLWIICFCNLLIHIIKIYVFTPNYFRYVLWTLERLVTDDYVMIYLHGAATKLPSFSWLKRCYEMVGRKLKKNLSHLYIVHPTLWIKTMLYMSKPFIRFVFSGFVVYRSTNIFCSSKFYRKISFIGSLRDLLARIPLEAAAIPDKVKAFDSLHGAQ